MALIDFVFTRAGEATRITKNGLLATVPSNFPVVNFDDGDLLGYYSQRAATNLLQRSEEFNNAYWGKSNATVTANATIAPDGTTTADLIYPSSTGVDRRVQRQISIVSGTTYTISVFVKASGLNWIRILEPRSFVLGTWFNLSNGTIGTIQSGMTADIKDFGNGWYRCSITRTVESTTTGQAYIQLVDNNNLQSVTANGTNGILFWGAQLEVGSEATSYIKTVDTTVTRNKDIATASGLTLSPLSNVQFKANFPTDYPLVIAGLQATVSGYRTIRLELSPTEKTLFVDGVEADTDTGSYDWSGITSIELGHFDGGEQPNFEIADLRINE
jgi:hypothetical protein